MECVIFLLINCPIITIVLNCWRNNDDCNYEWLYCELAIWPIRVDSFFSLSLRSSWNSWDTFILANAQKSGTHTLSESSVRAMHLWNDSDGVGQNIIFGTLVKREQQRYTYCTVQMTLKFISLLGAQLSRCSHVIRQKCCVRMFDKRKYFDVSLSAENTLQFSVL